MKDRKLNILYVQIKGDIKEQEPIGFKNPMVMAEGFKSAWNLQTPGRWEMFYYAESKMNMKTNKMIGTQ